MPWRPDDAPRHTKKVDTAELRELWSEVANKTLADTQDEARAVRTANAVVRRATTSHPEAERRPRRSRGSRPSA